MSEVAVIVLSVDLVPGVNGGSCGEGGVLVVRCGRGSLVCRRLKLDISGF